MILFLILVGLIVLSMVIGGLVHTKDRGEGVVGGFFIGLVVFGGIYVVSQFAGMVVNTKTIPQHTETKIVSIQDGTRTEGEFRGGLFVSRAKISETEYYMYYKANGDGTYSLDKQLVSHSVIAPDATPETAHLSSDSTLTTCQTKWWSTWCGEDSGIYTHGVFHVPANSITNDFVLDAQ